MALMSNMFVGSSSSRRSGWVKRALARASLILQPPLNSLVAMPCIRVEKPRPAYHTMIWGGPRVATFSKSFSVFLRHLKH